MFVRVGKMIKTEKIVRKLDVPIKVSIIEDDDWIRDNLATQIRRTSGFVCAGSYSNGEDALKQVPQNIPDVVLMDINLPRMTGIDCVRKLKALIPSTHVLMLTVYEDSDKIFNSLLAGASGYLLKRTPQAEIIDAIRDVHRTDDERQRRVDRGGEPPPRLGRSHGERQPS